MILKIGDIEIYVYDSSNKDQRHLKYVLNEDPAFLKYVTKKLDERLEESVTSDLELHFFNSYLVKYKNEFVGYLRLEEDKRRPGYVEIQCAISREFRNQKLGSRILETISDYILENYHQVKQIFGIIERNNYISQSMATKAGFLPSNRDDSYIYVTKER